MNDVPTLISINDIVRLTSLSRTAINKHRAAGSFPVEVQLGDRRIAFVRNEVFAWIEKRIRARQGRAANDNQPAAEQVA